MRCQFCDGGKIDWPTLIDGRQHTVKIDCPECGGTGHLHCCEGLREQPEKDREDEHADRGDTFS